MPSIKGHHQIVFSRDAPLNSMNTLLLTLCRLTSSSRPPIHESKPTWVHAWDLLLNPSNPFLVLRPDTTGRLVSCIFGSFSGPRPQDETWSLDNHSGRILSPPQTVVTSVGISGHGEVSADHPYVRGRPVPKPRQSKGLRTHVGPSRALQGS